MRFAVAVAFLMSAAAIRAEVPCPCDPHDSDTLRERPCSLCAAVEKEAAKQPGAIVLFVRDTNPLKSDRMLALPRMHEAGMHHIDDLPGDIRTTLWREAIAKAKELWGDRWGLAYNAESIHTQCHVHIHIGRMIDGVEWGDFKVVDGPEQIPAAGAYGLWIHAAGEKIHVHLGEKVTETVLLR